MSLEDLTASDGFHWTTDQDLVPVPHEEGWPGVGQKPASAGEICVARH